MASSRHIYSLLLVALTIWVTSSNMGNMTNINSFSFKKNDRGNLYVLNYTQKLEHFDHESELSNFKFQQRVLVNDSQWAGKCRWDDRRSPPIFAYFGGVDEGLIDPGQIDVLADFAMEFKAMLISIEHRFSGASIPLGSLDLAMANDRIKKSLSIENTLKDFANIIQSFKANYSAPNSPVVVVGTGYGGALAGWFQQKYPEIATGAHGIDTPKLLFHRILHHDKACLNWCPIVSNNSKIVKQLFLECAVAGFFQNFGVNSNGESWRTKPN